MAGIKNLVRAVVVLLFIVSFCARAEMVNPGFENTYLVDEKTLYQKSMQNSGWKFDEPLILPEGWKTNPGAFKNGEYRLITDKSKSHGGNNCVYLKGHFVHTRLIDVTAGDKLKISLYVRDPEKKNAGVYLYMYTLEGGKVSKFAGSVVKTVNTGEEWSVESAVFDIPEEKTGDRVNAVAVALYSSTGVFFDDVDMVHTRTSKWLNFQDAFIEGNKKLAKKDFEGAREDFDAALGLAQDKKERIDALLKIAETHTGGKDYLKAVDTFKRVLSEEKPANDLKVDMHMQVAEAYLKAGEYDKARETLEGVLDMGKESDGVKVDVQLKIADTWMKERKHAEAIEAFKEIFRMNLAGPVVRVSTQFKIGDAYAASGDNERARESYQKVLSLPATTFVDKFEAHKKTGDLFKKEKNYENALKCYESALNVEDVNSWSAASLLSVIGSTYEAEGRYEEARKTYSRIIDIGLSAWSTVKPAYIKIGQTYRKEGNYERERETYAEMFEWANEKLYQINIGIAGEVALALADMYRNTGDSYWEEGNREMAKHYYLLFLEVGKRMPPARLISQVEEKIGVNLPASHIRNGENLLFERKYGEAENEYGEVLISDKAIPRQKAFACMRIGDIYLARNNFDKARSQYLKAFKIKDAPAAEKTGVLMRMGDSYSIEQKYKEARAEYGKVLSMREASLLQKIDAQEKIAEMYRAENDYSRAKEEYGKILEMEGLNRKRKEEIEQRILAIYR